MRRDILNCLLLATLTLVAFWPVGRLGFILFDDHIYIVENPKVQAGITFESVHWAFTTLHAGNWHPITWLSHMLDYKLFGLKANDQHWMNLGFHIANTLLLYLLLSEMTGARWRSFLVAALFACHPAHVQSVAWISERKDVLSVFFGILTLWAYASYVRRVTSDISQAARREAPIPVSGWPRPTCHPSLFYTLALVFFALGLMSKPMLVTLPAIMLLLDFWPLGRIPGFSPSVAVPSRRTGGVRSQRTSLTSSLSALLLEKLPFLVLSLASCIITLCAQRAAEAVVSLDRVSWTWRIENSLASYSVYLGKIFWPENLAIFYPYTRIEPWEVLGSSLLLILLSFFCIRRMRIQPWLLAGWCWYLVTLLPVIGLVQVGMQSMADRYTYLPSIGLFIIVAWGMADAAARSNLWRTSTVIGAAGLLLACCLSTRFQLGFWRNNVMLVSHALEATGENPMGDFYLGNAFLEAGDLDQAVEHYRSALRMAPNLDDAYYHLGYVLLMQKKFDEAEAQFDEVLRLNSDNADAHAGLGQALAAQKKFQEAETEYSNALALKPGDANISKALAVATVMAESETALTNYLETLKTQPTPDIQAQVAAILIIQGRFPDAVEHYQAALQLKPDAPEILNNLAWLLATCPDDRVRNGAAAVDYARKAGNLTQNKQITVLGTLAAAYAEAGRFDEAVTTAQQACQLASEQNQPNLLKRNLELLKLYRNHLPYHEPGNPNSTDPATATPADATEKLVPAAP